MAAMSFEHADEVRAALHAIVSDLGHGIDALSRPQAMANLLQDLLPDAPRETGLLVAAASAGLSAMLREHVAQGLDAGTAVSLTASSFSGRTAFTPEACTWVVNEFAIALGLITNPVGTVAPVRRSPPMQDTAGQAAATVPPQTEPAPGRSAPRPADGRHLGKLPIVIAFAAVTGAIVLFFVLRGNNISPSPSGTAYVLDGNNGTVTSVSLATGKPGAQIFLGGDPAGIAITPDGKTAYVANYNDNVVTPIDLPSGTQGAPITIRGGPGAIAISPNGRTAYVATLNRHIVALIDLANGATTGVIAVPSSNTIGGLRAIAITANGRTAYVVDSLDNKVVPVDLATRSPGIPISAGSDPYAIAISPNGKTAYVVNRGDNTVSPINLATGAPGSPIRVGRDPDAIAITPDGSTAYVANYNDNSVTPINLAKGIPGAPIRVGSDPAGIAISPDGSFAYVASHLDGTLTPINLASGIPGAAIKAGQYADSIAINR